MNMIHKYIDLMISGIIILAIIMLVLFLYLVYKRIVQNNQLKRKNVYLKERLAEWDAYFRSEIALHDGMIPKNDAEIQSVESIFSTYINNFSDVEIKEKIQIFSCQHLEHYYKKLLQSKKWSIRINALNRVVDFQMGCLLDECKKMGQQKLSHEEFFLLLLIYSRLDFNHFLKVIQSTEEILSENEYKILLIELDSEGLKQVLNRFNEWNIFFQYALITVLGIKRDVSELSFLEERIMDDDPEIRIRALKAINEIGAISALEKYLPFVDSSIWEERLMVAKIFRNVAFERVLLSLKKLIHDESWWVRSEASKTLNQSRRGQVVLEEIIENSTDLFAMDMAKEYIKRG